MIYVVVVTVGAAAITYAADVSRLWLVASVFVLGTAGFLFFSSRTGWNFKR